MATVKQQSKRPRTHLRCAGTDLQCSWLGEAVSVAWNDTARMLASQSLNTMERMTSWGPALR
jgi:hypothetical protein